MAINFPNSPSNGATYVYRDIKYTYKDTGSGGYWYLKDLGTSTEATTDEVNTGTVSNKFISPDSLSGSKYDKTYSNSFTSNDPNTVATSKAIHDAVASAINSAKNPTATIVAYAGWVAPSGWLLCDGSAIPSQHTALISYVGNNTPDLRDMFIRGKSGSRAMLSEQDDAYRDHHHIAGVMSQYYPSFDDSMSMWGTFPSENYGSKGGSSSRYYDGAILQGGLHQEHHKNSGNTHYPLTSGGGQKAGTTAFAKIGVDDETRPKNIALNYIIKI